MVKDKDRMQRSIDELTEWQENQYNPGHWIGGITPNNLITPRKPKIVAAFLIMIALTLLVSFFFVLSDYLSQFMQLIPMEHFYYVAELVLLGVFSLLLLIGGILKVRRK